MGYSTSDDEYNDYGGFTGALYSPVDGGPSSREVGGINLGVRVGTRAFDYGFGVSFITIHRNSSTNFNVMAKFQLNDRRQPWAISVMPQAEALFGDHETDDEDGEELRSTGLRLGLDFPISRSIAKRTEFIINPKISWLHYEATGKLETFYSGGEVQEFIDKRDAIIPGLCLGIRWVIIQPEIGIHYFNKEAVWTFGVGFGG
jgi:hypothetical protein